MTTTNTPSLPQVSEDVQCFFDEVTKKHAPDAKIAPKESSRMMRVIGWLFKVLPISPTFMTEYITTINDTMNVPEPMMAELDVPVVGHETVHIVDNHTLGKVLYNFLYMFPQDLAVLSILSVLGIWYTSFLWCLLFLACLAPIPAPFRYWFELRGYRVQVLFFQKKDKYTPEQMESVYTWIIEQLATKLYYWTWPFPEMIHGQISNTYWQKKGIFKEIGNWIAVHRITTKIKKYKAEQNRDKTQ
jgi:hypothetical protein